MGDNFYCDWEEEYGLQILENLKILEIVVDDVKKFEEYILIEQRPLKVLNSARYLFLWGHKHKHKYLSFTITALDTMLILFPNLAFIYGLYNYDWEEFQDETINTKTYRGITITNDESYFPEGYDKDVFHHQEEYAFK